MVLNKHIAGSGIAEVVVALAIISICFTVASLVFIRATSAPMKFQDVRIQTEIQSEVLMHMYDESDAELHLASSEYRKEQDLNSDQLEQCVFEGTDGRIVWIQQWFSFQTAKRTR